MAVLQLMLLIHGAQQLPTMIRMASLEYAWVSEVVTYKSYAFEKLMMYQSCLYSWCSTTPYHDMDGN